MLTSAMRNLKRSAPGVCQNANESTPLLLNSAQMQQRLTYREGHLHHCAAEGKCKDLTSLP